MATVVQTPIVLPVGYKYRGCNIISWTPLTLANPGGAPLDFPGATMKSVAVFGTFGAGGNLAIQGSPDGTNWGVLHDPQGNLLNITAAGSKLISEANIRWVRPLGTAGDGTTSLTCFLFVNF